MRDLIDRQAAIKNAHFPAIDDASYEVVRVDDILALPSAQPVAKDINVPVRDCISRQAAISICDNAIDLWNGQLGTGALVAVRDAIMALPSAQPEVRPIDYHDCSNAMLKMWMDNVVTDGEYNRIMDKLNAHWGKKNG